VGNTSAGYGTEGYFLKASGSSSTAPTWTNTFDTSIYSNYTITFNSGSSYGVNGIRTDANNYVYIGENSKRFNSSFINNMYGAQVLLTSNCNTGVPSYYGYLCCTTLTANRRYYLPDAGGTIALTSNLSSYLPLSGGTITGTLTCNSSFTCKGTANFYGNGIEIFYSTPFIDFHYNNSTGDHDGRIVQTATDYMEIQDTNLRTNKTISAAYFSNYGNTGTVISNNNSSNIWLQSLATVVTNVTGTAYAAIYASAFNVSSSKLIKENITPIKDENAYKLLNVNVVDFDYKESFGGTKGLTGCIAEEVLPLLPNVVNVPEDYNEEDFDESKGLKDNKILSIDYSKFVPYLIRLVQLQQQEIDELKSKI
jgi:hypothetical protein